MKKIFLLLITLFSISAVNAGDYLHVVDFTAKAGVTNTDYQYTFDVELVNEVADTYTSLMFDLYLPEGMALLDADDNFDASKTRLDFTTGRNPAPKATIEVTQKEGFYRVTLFHTDLEKIHGTSGALLSFYYTTSSDMKNGAQEIKITNQNLSKDGSAEGQVYPEDQISTVTITGGVSDVTELGKANIATEVLVSAAYSESGKDIPAAGGKDRAAAKVTYKYLTRTFMSDGTYTDGEASSAQEVVIYGDYVEAESLGTNVKERTKVASSNPSGSLTDAEGNVLKAETTEFEKLADCSVSASVALDIYQEANAASYSDVELVLSAEEVSLSGDGETYDITKLVTASQTVSFTSGSTSPVNVTINYAVKTAKDGYSLSEGNVVVTENQLPAANNGFVVTVSAEGEGNKSASKDVTFNQTVSSSINAIQVGSANGKMFDMNGRVVNSTSNKGVYIINNKKFIVR